MPTDDARHQRARNANNSNSGTGWYGIPGSLRQRDSTQVHFVLNGRPICGAIVRKAMTFQQCVPGFEKAYVECERCRQIGLPR
jgi:hypothetical protein